MAAPLEQRDKLCASLQSLTRARKLVGAAGWQPDEQVCGATALHYATGHDIPTRLSCGKTTRLQVLSLLLRHCDPTIADHRGMTPLHWAVLSGCADTVALIAADDRVALDARDGCGLTPLILSVKQLKLPALQALLMAGADINTADSAQFGSPLLWACHMKDLHAVTVLARAPGIDLETKSGSTAWPGMTAVHVAVSTGCVDVLGELLASGADPLAVIASASGGKCALDLTEDPAMRTLLDPQRRTRLSPESRECSTCRLVRKKDCFSYKEWYKPSFAFCLSCLPSQRLAVASSSPRRKAAKSGHANRGGNGGRGSGASKGGNLSPGQQGFFILDSDSSSSEEEAPEPLTRAKSPRKLDRKPDGGTNGKARAKAPTKAPTVKKEGTQGKAAPAKGKSSKGAGKGKKRRRAASPDAASSTGDMPQYADTVGVVAKPCGDLSLYKTVAMQDIVPHVKAERKQVIEGKIVKLFYRQKANRFDPPPRASELRFDSNIDINVPYSRVKAELLRHGLSPRGTASQLNERLSEFEYGGCIGWVSNDLCMKQIEDPTNPAKHFAGERKAYGLFSKPGIKPIRKGQILGEYVGEVKTMDMMMQSTHLLETDGDMVSKRDQEYSFDLTASHEWIKKSKARGPGDRLVVDARVRRNCMALCNDYRGFDGLPDREQNVAFREVVINGWPHIFVTAIMTIGPHTELLTDYGEGFWEQQETIRRDQKQMELEIQRATKAAVQRVTTLMMDTLASVVNPDGSSSVPMREVMQRLNTVLDADGQNSSGLAGSIAAAGAERSTTSVALSQEDRILSRLSYGVLQLKQPEETIPINTSPRKRKARGEEAEEETGAGAAAAAAPGKGKAAAAAGSPEARKRRRTDCFGLAEDEILCPSCCKAQPLDTFKAHLQACLCQAQAQTE